MAAFLVYGFWMARGMAERKTLPRKRRLETLLIEFDARRLPAFLTGSDNSWSSERGRTRSRIRERLRDFEGDISRDGVRDVCRYRHDHAAGRKCHE